MDDPALPITLYPTLSPGASITQTEPGQFRLGIPAGSKGRYRVAQIDDYRQLARQKFIWKAPVELNLVAKASSRNVPGTWGFGFWNDPFSLALPAEARAFRLPNLPNTAWFFFASPENYLSLRDDLPANGNLSAVFHSTQWFGAFSMLLIPFLPIVLVRPLARWLRRFGRKFIQERSVHLLINPDETHHYLLKWEASQIRFWIDSEMVLQTNIVPRGPLGFLAWVDNQYAAYLPDGQIRFGMLANPEPTWIEIEKLQINDEIPILEQSQ